MNGVPDRVQKLSTGAAAQNDKFLSSPNGNIDRKKSDCCFGRGILLKISNRRYLRNPVLNK